MIADSGIAKVTAGSTMAAGVPSLTAGKSGSRKEKNCSSMSPTQKVGRATPSPGRAASASRSNGRRLRVADTAMMIPTRSAMTRASAASASVEGRAEAIASVTGVPAWIDVPRSKRSRLPNAKRYWTMSGWSRWNSARSRATSAGSKLCSSPPAPSIVMTGSPGSQ